MRPFRLISLCMLLFLVSAAYAQDGAALLVLERLNQVRVDAGLHPLQLSTQLMQAAERHSRDMATNNLLSHTGSDGSEFWERIADTGYVLVSGAENSLADPVLDAGRWFEQWRSSPSHNSNMMNPGYAEAGIAYARSGIGAYYVTLVLASRADVAPLPAGVMPTPVHTSAPSIAIMTNPPSAAGAPASLPTMTPVSPAAVASSIAPALPDALLPTATPPPPTPTAMPPTAIPTSDPAAAVMAASVAVAQQVRAAAVGDLIRFTDRFAPPPTAVPTAMPTATMTPADLRLIYDSDSFTLVNVSARPLYLGELVFTSDAGAMPIEKWETAYLSEPLDLFGSGGCLQTWSLNTVDVRPAPPDCGIRHSWVAVADDQVFWRGVDRFRVVRGDTLLATCTVFSGQCDVRLDEGTLIDQAAAPAPQSPASSAVIGPADLRLIYSSLSLSLINTSGQTLDLSGLAFESTNGVMLASSWNSGDMSRSLAAFPAGDCLQTWPVGAELQPRPESCNLRHGWVAVRPEQQFWLDAGVFIVRWGAQALATCSVAGGLCDVNLP